MAVTAVTITSGPTVVGRSVTLSGTLSRDGGGTNNNLNFLCYSVGYVAVYTITKLSDNSTFYNASGTAGSGIAWTWTGTLPEGDYLTVTVNLNEAPYTTLATSGTNVGLVQLRKPLPGIWTPNRDSRGLFVPKADGVDSPISSTAGGISTRKFHYNYAVAGSNGIYTTVFNKILRRSDQTYGPVNLRSVNTPYGVGIDAQTGLQIGGYPVQGGGYNVARQTWISLFYIYDAAKAITNYPRFFGAVGNNPSNRSNTISWNNPAGEQALVVTSNTGFSGGEVAVNGVGNGLHCMVVTSVASTSAGSIRIFLDGEFVATTTGPNGWLGGEFPNTDFFANSVSQSGLNIGNILFNAILYNYVAPDSEALKLSTNPYSYFFRDAPKTTAKHRLFSGVLSLPDPPTEFTSTKAGRVRPSTLRQQPQGAVQIDWSHPLARGLVYAQVPGSARRGFFRFTDPQITSSNFGTGLSNGIFSYSVEAATNGTGIKGRSTMTNTAGATSGTLTLRPSQSGGSPVYTYAGVFERSVLDTAQQSIATFAINGGSALTSITQNSGGSVSTFSTRFVDGFSTTQNYSATVTNLIVDKKPNVVFSVYENGQVPIGIVNNTQLTLDNGTVFDGVSTTFGSNYLNATGTYVGFGAFFWARKLTAAEIASFTENPWQLFKPAAGRLYFLPATTTAFKGGRFLPQRWKTQPQGNVQIDWSSSLSRNLLFAYLPNNPINLAQQYNTQQFIGDNWSIIKTGVAGIVTDYQSYTHNSSIQTGPFTIGMPGQLYGPTPTLLTDFSYVTRSAYDLGLYLSFSNSSNIRLVPSVDNSAFVTTTVTGNISPSLLTNKTRFVAGTFSTTEVAAWLGNTKLATTTGWDNTVSSPLTTFDVSGYLNQTGFALSGFIWRRELSANELGLMDENPWQIFKPNPGRVYYIPPSTTQFKGGRFLPQRWKTQPQGKIDMDWNHPIAQGLNRSIVITGVGAQNPARPKQLVKYSTRANAFAYSTQGVGLDGSSSEGHQVYLDADSSMSGANKATYFVYGYTKDRYVYGGVSQQSILQHANQHILKTGYAGGQSISYTLTTSNFEYLGYDATNVVSNYSKFSAAMTFTLGGTQYYYHQGKLVGTNAGTTTATLRYDEGYPLPFTLGGYNGLDSQIGLLWTRGLSDREIAELHENPWQIFKPNPGRIYFLPGATRRGKFLFLFS